MITLPNLAASDTTLTGPDATAKTTGIAEDFLALLAGALTQTDDDDGEKIARLTHDAMPTPRDSTVRGPSLTQWRVLQEADGTETDAHAQNDAQTLLGALAAHLKGEFSVNRAGASARDANEKTTDDTLNDDDLNSLSALMAMLPAAPQLQQMINDAAPLPPRDTLATSLQRGGEKNHGLVALKGELTAQPQSDTRALPADAAFIIPAQKALAENASSPTAPTTFLAPAASAAAAPAPAVATVNVNAPLGTPDWQQNVSQHITLFTRQGQQTAELRLHPESLGQVHITLKVEDNLAQIQMTSPHSHVRAALEAALPVLRSQLEDNGIQLGQSNISSDGFGGQQQQPSSRQSFASHGESGAGEGQQDDVLLTTPAALQSAARGDNAVDIFA